MAIPIWTNWHFGFCNKKLVLRKQSMACICSSCLQSDDDDKLLKCQYCPVRMHYSCAGVTDSITMAKIKYWVCFQCRQEQEQGAIAKNHSERVTCIKMTTNQGQGRGKIYKMLIEKIDSNNWVHRLTSISISNSENVTKMLSVSKSHDFHKAKTYFFTSTTYQFHCW